MFGFAMVCEFSGLCCWGGLVCRLCLRFTLLFWICWDSGWWILGGYGFLLLVLLNVWLGVVRFGCFGVVLLWYRFVVLAIDFGFSVVADWCALFFVLGYVGGCSWFCVVARVGCGSVVLDCVCRDLF